MGIRLLRIVIFIVVVIQILLSILVLVSKFDIVKRISMYYVLGNLVLLVVLVTLLNLLNKKNNNQ